MKVLFLTNVPSPYRVDFFNALGRLCDLTVLFETKSAKSRDAAWIADKIENFKAIYLKGIRIGEAESFSVEVLKYLSNKKYDIIVVGLYSSPTGMLAIEYMKTRKIPFVLSSDGGLIKNDTGVKKYIKSRYIGAASAWLSTGKATTEYLCYYGALEEKTYIYPFTSVLEKDVLKEKISFEEREKIRKKLDVQEEIVALSVGQFIYRKGYDLLLKAWKNVNKNIGLYIVGGIPTGEYASLKSELGLANVHFVNFMPKKELADYYKAADVFILPTREDIWGLVINEACAYGLPIITTDKCVAGTEVVEQGKTGYVVKLEEIAKINQYISMALDLDHNDILETAKKYTLENMAGSHLDIFKMILKNRGEK